MSHVSSLGSEALDSPHLDVQTARATLRDIAQANRLFGGTAAVHFGLDRVLEGELPIDERLSGLLAEVVGALPDLVLSYRQPDGLDLDSVRNLTNRCFEAARASEEDLAHDLAQVDGGSVGGAAVAAMPAASQTVGG